MWVHATGAHPATQTSDLVGAVPGGVLSRDLGVTVALRETLPEWAVALSATLATLGDLLVIVPVLGVLYLADVGHSLRRGPQTGEPLCSDRTAFLIATVFGGLALVVLLKGTLALPRPPAELHAVPASEHGFPSGHTMAATVCWGALALWLEVGRRRSRLAVAAAVITLVAGSRLALGVHYLPDVVASVAFGVAYLGVFAVLVGTRPARAFAIAVVIAVLATLATGGESRAVLALSGTVGAAIGWQFVEFSPVRRRLSAAVGGSS